MYTMTILPIGHTAVILTVSCNNKMKRDLDLSREILFQIEKKTDPSGWLYPKVEGRSEEEISYHIMIMEQAGLIEAKDLTTKDGFLFAAKNLTWNGHEFLDASRRNTTWNKVKRKLGERFSSASFDIVKSVAISIFKSEMGIE